MNIESREGHDRILRIGLYLHVDICNQSGRQISYKSQYHVVKYNEMVYLLVVKGYGCTSGSAC